MNVLVTGSTGFIGSALVRYMTGKGHEVQSRHHAGAHGEAVAQRVGGGDGPEVVRVVHDGGEEIHRLDDGQVFAEPIDPRIVSGVGAEQKIRVGEGRQPFQGRSKVLGTDLAPSAAGFDKAGQQEFFFARGRQRSPSAGHRGAEMLIAGTRAPGPPNSMERFPLWVPYLRTASGPIQLL